MTLRFLTLLFLLALCSTSAANNACQEFFHSRLSYKSQITKAIQIEQSFESLDRDLIHLFKAPKIDPISVDLRHLEAIVRGHFPEQRIIPGALTAQIMSNASQRILNEITGLDYKLLELKEMHFLRPLSPNKTVRLELDFNDLNFANKFNSSKAVVTAKIYVRTRLMAEGELVLTAGMKTGGSRFFSPELKPNFIDTKIIEDLPQKYEMKFTDALTYTSFKPETSSADVDQIINLKGFKSQTAFFLKNHPFLTKANAMPTALQVEVMAQSAIAGILYPLKGQDFNVLLTSVKETKFYKPMALNRQFNIQSKVLHAELASETATHRTYNIQFKTSMTHKRRVFSEGIIEGIVIIKTNSK